MSKDEGLQHRYDVTRVDKKPITLGCVVLEFSDERAWPALLKWADTMEADGYAKLAQDVRRNVEAGRRAKVRKTAFEREEGVDADS
jgi:hypothetical protein